MANYYIIEFKDGLALVPSNWMSKTKTLCFYPNYNSKKMKNAVKNKEIPDIKNKEVGWAMYDVVCIFGEADSFQRGQEKLEAAESVSDLNTDNEENLKKTRQRRARRSPTSDEEGDVSGTDSSWESRLPPFPNPEKFSRSQSVFNEQPKTKILASYEEPGISKNDEISLVKAKILPKIIKQEIFQPAKYENRNDIDKVHEDSSDKVFLLLSEILKKVNRLSVEVAYINRQLVDYFENRQPHQKYDATLNAAVEAASTFKILTTVDDFESFDQTLHDGEVFERMKQVLLLKGGNNLHDVIKNILKTLLEDEVLTFYSWKGAREKKGFYHFKVVDLVIAVTRLHFKNTTEEAIRKEIANWLVQAPVRVRRHVEKKETIKNSTKRIQITKGCENNDTFTDRSTKKADVRDGAVSHDK